MKRIADRYQILELVGCGSQARVYKSHDILLDKNVALKVYPDFSQFGDQQLCLQIENEYYLLKSLDHVNTIQVFDLVKEDQQIIIVMEFIEGPTLRSVLDNHFSRQISILNDFIQDSADSLCQLDSDLFVSSLQNISELKQSKTQRLFCSDSLSFTSYDEFVEIIVRQLMDLFDYIQLNTQVIHQDIKPDNIIITKDQVIKLLDFGFVSSKILTETYLGTYGYLAPEIFNGDTYSNKVDIWSLGCVFYELVNGYCPISTKRNIPVFIAYQYKNCAFIPERLFDNYENSSVRVLYRQMLLFQAKERPHAFDLQLNKVAQPDFLTQVRSAQEIKYIDFKMVFKKNLKTLTIQQCFRINLLIFGDKGVGKTDLYQLYQLYDKNYYILNSQYLVYFHVIKSEVQDSRQSMIPTSFRNCHIALVLYKNSIVSSRNNCDYYKAVIQKFNQDHDIVFINVCTDSFSQYDLVGNDFQIKQDLSAVQVKKLLDYAVNECLDRKIYIIEEFYGTDDIIVAKSNMNNTKKGCC